MRFRLLRQSAPGHQIHTFRLSVVLAVFGLAMPSVISGTLLGTGSASAQNTNATIRGQVLDATGALIANAHVVVVNVDTGVKVFDGKADSAGEFVAPQVIPGTYRVSVDAPGQKETVIDHVVASVAQVTSLDVKMEVGAVSDVVTVQAKGEELDRGTSDISTLISPNEVQNLPLVQRQTENLLSFIPGVVHGGAADTPSTSQLSINGSRTLNTEVLLNGVSTIVASTGSPATLPSPDGVDQFRVLATNAPAEYGRTSGAVISVNTISGTNNYHGNLYFLMRNEDFDANSYFNNTSTRGCRARGIASSRWAALSVARCGSRRSITDTTRRSSSSTTTGHSLRAPPASQRPFPRRLSAWATCRAALQGARSRRGVSAYGNEVRRVHRTIRSVQSTLRPPRSWRCFRCRTSPARMIR